MANILKLSTIKIIVLLLCLCLSDIINAQKSNLKAGDVAPNAKTIECDELFPFHLGYAAVRKGDESYAIIDTSLKPIVPYNKYRLMDVASRGYQKMTLSEGKQSRYNIGFNEPFFKWGYWYVYDNEKNQNVFLNKDLKVLYEVPKEIMSFETNLDKLTTVCYPGLIPIDSIIVCTATTKKDSMFMVVLTQQGVSKNLPVY